MKKILLFVTGIVLVLSIVAFTIYNQLDDIYSEIKEAESSQVEIIATELDLDKEEILFEDNVFYTPKGNYKAKFSKDAAGEQDLIKLYPVSE